MEPYNVVTALSNIYRSKYKGKLFIEDISIIIFIFAISVIVSIFMILIFV